MPLNEARGFHTNLTQEQKREAERALYGLENVMPAEATQEEMNRMREILAQHDAKTQAAGMKDFDLNKPPTAPYVYREFPFLMYHHRDKKTMPARTHEERERLLADGWSVDPFPSGAQPEIPLTAEQHAEAESLDKRLAKKK